MAASNHCMQRSAYSQPHQAYPTTHQQYGVGGSTANGVTNYYDYNISPMQLPMASGNVPSGVGMYSSPPALHQVYSGRPQPNGEISPQSPGQTAAGAAGGVHPEQDMWNKFVDPNNKLQNL